MKNILNMSLISLLLATVAVAQENNAPSDPSGNEESASAEAAELAKANEEKADSSVQEKISGEMDERLRKSLEELTALREQIVEDTVPLNRELNELLAELQNAREDYQKAVRLRDQGAFELVKLTEEIKARTETGVYLSNFISEYLRNWESRMPISEMQIYGDQIEAARTSPGDGGPDEAAYQSQTGLILTALERLDQQLGGHIFQGSAMDDAGVMKDGTFLVLGPTQFFRSADGVNIGNIELRNNSFEPSIAEFRDPNNLAAAERVITTSSGYLPLDPTLGNARVIEATEVTWREYIEDGGVVVWPIIGLAAAAFLTALFKWIALIAVPRASGKKVDAMLQRVAEGKIKAARQVALTISGPTGRMLSAGLGSFGESKELIEEVMYEKILVTRLKVQRFLPFIAITAAASPLLGLLGTVTGIINTFKMITIFGTGDVKTLSSGISEALITTQVGLVVAIPALLFHAYLYRQAKGITDRMEQSAMSLLNHIKDPIGGRSHHPSIDQAKGTEKSPDATREALAELLRPILDEPQEERS